MKVHYKPSLAVMLAFVCLTLALTWDAWTNSAGYGSFEPPLNPPSYSQQSHFFWSAIRSLFFLALPSPFKILWFPCMLQQMLAYSMTLPRAQRPSIGQLRRISQWNMRKKDRMEFFFYIGDFLTCLEKAFIVPISAVLNGFLPLRTHSRLSFIVLLDLIFYCPIVDKMPI